ncbi:MAG: CRISPR-associated endonuclease Cas2 [Spirulina sp. SIO3F2]|nr:CRISPR-associated endonuclease Cas2 [Spirulina sp. SIO3F2]
MCTRYFLEGWGRRVQYSVFECFLDLSRMQNLYEAVKKYVDLEVDNVRFYYLSEQAVARVLTLGSPPPEPPPSVYII